MVSAARAIADPEFANKARAGDRAGISICIACCNQACGSLLHRPAGELRGESAGGARNQAGLSKTKESKSIAIIGGGPAGLSCAANAAERGTP